MPKVRFEPTGRTVESVREGETLAEITARAGVPLDSVCGGKGTCGRCRVIITSEVAPITDEERELIPAKDLERGVRLACRTKVDRDLVAEVPEEFARAGQLILEKADVDVDLDPLLRRVQVKVFPPSIHFPVGDYERLERALDGIVPSGKLFVPLRVLRSLSELLRAHDEISILLRGNEVIDLTAPGPKSDNGVAIDIGTTTIVAYLMDLSSGKEICVRSEMNPQIGHGDDVISRITFAMERPDGGAILQSLVIECVNNLIDACCSSAGISTKEVYEVVAVGNTAMHHLLLGLDASPLAHAPYVPVVTDAIDTKSVDLGINVLPEGYVHTLPNIAGFVGADHVAVLMASLRGESDRPRLVVDIGTNGEISLVCSKGIASTSCAAGPAFEGANLSFGMRGTEGAIDHLYISDDMDVAYSTIGKAKPRGLCGSGVLDAVAEMFRTGILDSSGRIVEELHSPRILVRNGESRFVIATEKESAIGEPIVITQNDILQIQYAKAAMYVGATVLMERMGVIRDSLDRIHLAGAFGNYADPRSARMIGLLPDIPLEKIEGIGNAAGTGAKMALLNRRVRDEASVLAEKIEYVELAAQPGFEDKFYSALFFPHLDTSLFPAVCSETGRG